MSYLGALSLSLLSLLGGSSPRGVVVEAMQPGFAAQRAGLRAGDVLLGWQRDAAADGLPSRGEVSSPLAALWLEREVAGRGAVTLLVLRDGTALRVAMPAGEWGVELGPALAPPHAQVYAGVRERTAAGDSAGAAPALSELADRLRLEGDRNTAAWLLVAAGKWTISSGDHVLAERHFAAAAAEAAELGDTYVVALVHGLGAEAFRLASDLDRAAAAYGAALKSHEGLGKETLGEAWVHQQLSRVAAVRVDMPAVEHHVQRGIAIRERLAPASAGMVESLFNCASVTRRRDDLAGTERLYLRALAISEQIGYEPGVVSALQLVGSLDELRGDLATADVHYQRALGIVSRWGAETRAHGAVLATLGHLAFKRGDLATAEDYQRRALAIEERLGTPLGVANTLHALSMLALARGDLASAEDYSSRALALREPRAPQSAPMGLYLTARGMIAEQRGDLAGAEGYLRRALAVKERVAPETIDVRYTLDQLARVALARGDLAQAREHLARALAIEERTGVTGEETGLTHRLLGDVAVASGDLAAAEASFQRALALERQLSPGTLREAESCQRLAALHRRRGQPLEALAAFRCALDALEAHRRTLGGPDDVQARFGAEHAAYYRQTVELLLELGRAEEAFQVVERSRARGLLALLAERDLVFSADVSAELERERHALNAEYDRTFSRLARARENEAPTLRATLSALRRQQVVLQDRIRAASPRLAALQYPQPLDLAGVRAALDPGTVLLSYLLGEKESHLFVVGPGPNDFAVLPLAASGESLRADATRLRELLQAPSTLTRGWLDALLRRLGEALLAPAREQIGRAERLLVLPDGPLHLIPFAALADPTATAGQRPVAANKPVHVAASATVFAELKGRRREGVPQRLIAFADPDYSALAGGREAAAPAELRSAQQHGLALRPLPGARREAETIAALHPGAAQVYLGADATEEKAKTMAREGTLLHFACHGLADESSPLDSALALALPASWQEGRDNGLLQVWEIFEQVRIDAELVTLSACSSALGKEMSGEGILGLTRAFQFAGARSVLASLWEVGDDSTAKLMASFYRHLAAGRSKDVALQLAQREMLADPATAHPHQWAAFQVIGDWR